MRVAVVLLLSACASLPAPGAEDASQVFASREITMGNVYRGVFSPNGEEFYFFRKVSEDPQREDYRIFRMRRTADGWTTPDTLRLGASASDLYPAIDPTGRYLVFSSYRPAPGDTASRPSAYLWIAERQGDGWSEPRFAANASTFGSYHAQLSFDRTGRLHYVVQSGDYRTKIGEFDAMLTNGKLSKPTPSADFAAMQQLAASLHLWETMPGWDSMYHIAVASERDANGRPLPADLYISLRQADGWSPLRPLPFANSPGTENFPFVGADGRLYFVRDFNEFRSIDFARALMLLRETAN